MLEIGIDIHYYRRIDAAQAALWYTRVNGDA
jgi:hypothetical protein